MLVDWKRVHITAENLYNGSIQKHRQGSWDFSYLGETIQSELKQNPGTNAYLYCTVEGCFDPSRQGLDEASQAPNIVVLVVPDGRIPPSFVAYNDVQNQREMILPFQDVQLRWEQLCRRSRNNAGGVYALQCDTDLSLIPDDEEQRKFHEYLDIFCLGPSEYKRNKFGQLIVPDVTYSVILPSGEEENIRFDKRDDTWKEHVEAELEALYDITEDSPPEVREEKELMMQTKYKQAVAQERQQREEKIRRYGDGEMGPSVLRIIKVCPRNSPAQTRMKLATKSFDSFPTSYKKVVSMGVSNWASSASSLVFDIQQGIDSPFGHLCEALLVEFLDKTGCIRYIPRGVFSVLGLSRIAQYFGKDLLTMFAFDRQPVQNFLRDAVVSLMKKVRINGKGRLPNNMEDFLLNYSFASNENVLPGDDKFPARLHLTGNQLEVSFAGSPEQVPITAVTLAKYLSNGAAALLIMELLQHSNPHAGIEIPSGAREGKEENILEKENMPIRVDCFKQALLKVPDHTLSPEGKRRAKISMPDHEIPFAVAHKCAQTSIRTILLKREKQNPHEVAMKSDNMMIGEFVIGNRSHSVLIDGKAGTITDPVDSFGTVERSSKGLEQLGIAQFHTVTTVKRAPRELTEKKRCQLQEDLKLPFIKG